MMIPAGPRGPAIINKTPAILLEVHLLKLQLTQQVQQGQQVQQVYQPW